MRQNMIAALLCVAGIGMAGIATASPPAPGAGLATFTTCMKLEGMDAAGSVPGAGDRATEFVVQIPADDMDLANTLWYLRLLVLTSPETLADIQAAVR